MPRANYMPFPFQIFQTPEEILIVYEYKGAVRSIYMNRNDEAPGDTWMGWSNGRWDGDTLVVDVTGFNGNTWFDRAGNFHSDALHVVERWTPISPYHMRYEATHRRPQGLYAALEDELSRLSPRRAERPAGRVQLRAVRRRDDVRRRSASTGRSPGRRSKRQEIFQMRTRILVQCGAVTLGDDRRVLVAAPVGVAGQTRAEVADAARKAFAAHGGGGREVLRGRGREEDRGGGRQSLRSDQAAWTLRMRTPWGDPDLRGYWLILQLHAARTPRGVRRQAAADAAGGDRSSSRKR